MRKILTLGFIVGTFTSAVFASTATHAAPLMTKGQYADYSVQYRCAEIQYHDDLAKKESELIRIENDFGLTDDNFDEFDELITEYERDDSLLEKISMRAQMECK